MIKRSTRDTCLASSQSSPQPIYADGGGPPEKTLVFGPARAIRAEQRRGQWPICVPEQWRAK